MLSLALEDKYKPFTGNDSIHVDKITLPLTISFPFRFSKNECTLRETFFSLKILIILALTTVETK